MRTLDIAELRDFALGSFEPHLREVKRACAPDDFRWYPYHTFGNLNELEALLHGQNRDLNHLAPSGHVADIGAADGDIAFLLASVGFSSEIIDHAPSNMNGLTGARLLKEALSSSVTIHDIDLDAQFALPTDAYDLVFFLGVLYHLKNPFYVLEALARRARRLFLSTRIARLAGPGVSIRDLPVGYLLGDREANNDPTNFWIFSEAGLMRLLTRTGWVVEELITVGDTEASDPSSQDHDERAFCLVRSTHT